MLEPVGDETQNPKICTDIESFSDTYFFQDKSETCFTTKFFETKPRFSIPNLTKPCFNQTNPGGRICFWNRFQNFWGHTCWTFFNTTFFLDRIRDFFSTKYFSERIAENKRYAYCKQRSVCAGENRRQRDFVSTSWRLPFYWRPTLQPPIERETSLQIGREMCLERSVQS